MSGISGVPTRTTSTLTPTTLRNIEQVSLFSHFTRRQIDSDAALFFIDVSRSPERPFTIGTVFSRFRSTTSANQSESVHSPHEQPVTTIPATHASAATAAGADDPNILERTRRTEQYGVDGLIELHVRLRVVAHTTANSYG